MAVSKNPTEIAYVGRKNTVFAVFDGLSEANIENGDEPLTLHSKSFSRFHFAMIDSEKGSVTANINIRDIFGLIKRSEYAFKKDLESAASNDGATISPAYTVMIPSGPLKGRTPADVLINDGETGAELLTNHYYFLEDNLAKYPKNQIQMDAIMEAFDLRDANKLDSSNAQKKEVVLYSSGLRPLIRKKHKNNPNLSFVYEITIKWYLGTEYPVAVQIKNYYAPVIQKPDKTLNVQVKNRDPNSLIETSFSMTYGEWAYVIHMIETSIRLFESSIYRKKREESVKYSKENRENARGEQETRPDVGQSNAAPQYAPEDYYDPYGNMPQGYPY